MLSSPPHVITVPIQIFIITELDMEKKGQIMTSWVKEDDVGNTLLPEVNRIWAKANIAFEINKVSTVAALRPPKRQQLIHDIVSSKRDTEGKSNPKRIKKLAKFLDFSAEMPGVITIYLVPYLGETSQGNAKRALRRITLAQWTDKPSKARSAPIPVALVESPPFRRGSLGRTLAHELGHILGLRHPQKSRQVEVNLLMGGKQPGYGLSRAELDVARDAAWSLLNP